MSPLARALTWAIERYQAAGGGQRVWVECNFTPSCSEYAKTAIERHGAMSGSKLAVLRLKRCSNRDQVGTTDDPVPSERNGAKMVSQDSADAEEERIRLRVRELPDPIRIEYFRRLQPRLRDPDTYAVLSYCLVTGLRHMYLGRWPRGFVDVGALVLGVVLLVTGNLVGVAPLAVIGVLDLLALFRSQAIVKDHNNQLARAILTEVTGAQRIPSATPLRG